MALAPVGALQPRLDHVRRADRARAARAPPSSARARPARVIVPCTGAELGQSSAAQTKLRLDRRRRPSRPAASTAPRSGRRRPGRVNRHSASAGSRSRPAAEAGRERVVVRPREALRGRARPPRRARPARGPSSASVRRPRLGHDARRRRAARRRRRAAPPRAASRAAAAAAASPRPPARRPAAPAQPGRVAAVARAGRPVEAARDHDRPIGHAPHRALSCPPRGARLGGTLHHRAAGAGRRRARARARGAPARLLPAHAREHAQDARGAQRRGAGDAVPGRPRRGDLGAAGGGADLRRRRRAHDRAGRRAARAGGRGGRSGRRRGADRAGSPSCWRSSPAPATTRSTCATTPP